MKEIQQHIETIQQELQDHPKDAGKLNELGVGYYLLGEYEQSIAILKRAAAMDDKNHTIRFNLGNSYAEQHDMHRAKHHLMDAIELKPDYVPALNNLADIYEQTGDKKRARELFAYITQIEPENALGYFNLGNFYLRQNNTVKAGNQYQQAIALDPDFYEAFYTIGFILKHLNKYKEAIPYFEQCLSINPAFEAAKKDLETCKKEI